MCMIDDGDGYSTILADDRPKARKEHRCAECGRVISPGEQYRSERLLYDGKITRHKTCDHCMVARQWLGDECGGWLYGGVEEDLREHAHDSSYAIDVKRLAIGMQWRWRTPSGRMLPVPRVPLTSLERKNRSAATR